MAQEGRVSHLLGQEAGIMLGLGMVLEKTPILLLLVDVIIIEGDLNPIINHLVAAMLKDQELVLHVITLTVDVLHLNLFKARGVACI